MSYSASIDVPTLEAGLRFYGGVFGYAERSRPVPGLAVIGDGTQELILLERAEGSAPYKGAGGTRSYARHWTPVHLDFHVADVLATLARAEALGATREALHEIEGRSPVAFIADPFGHGLCLIGRR